MDMQLRKHFKSLTKKRRDGTRLCDGKFAHEDPSLVLALLDVSHDYANFVRGMKMHDAINILLGLDLYSKDKQRKMYTDFYSLSRQNFSKEMGRIVTVDFFGHFGTELAYEHPAIVLGAEGASVLVAPLSSPAYGRGRGTHVDLEIDSGVVSLNSAILLEKIRYVSKNRILVKHKKLSERTVTPTNSNYGIQKLKEIDDKLAQLLVPHQYKRFNRAQTDLIRVQTDLTQTKSNLTQTKSDLAKVQLDLTQAEASLKSLEALKAEHYEVKEQLKTALETIALKDKEITELKLKSSTGIAPSA